MTSGEDLFLMGPSILICKTSQWTGPCVMQFLAEDYSEHTMTSSLCQIGKYTLVLSIRAREGDSKVPAPSSI